MKILIIYDDTGYVIQEVREGFREPQGGIQYLIVDIPEGKQIKYTDGIGVDVTVIPHQVIFEDIPLSEVELLKQQVLEMQSYIVEQQYKNLLTNGGM